MNDRIEAVAQAMTEAMITSLREGVANPAGWTAPWHHTNTHTAHNAATGKRYTGGNWAWLTLSEAVLGATAPWATYRQWKALGAQVRKGEHGTPILAPRPHEREEEDGTITRWVTFTTHTVFHAGQVDGWKQEQPERVTEGERNPEADAWMVKARDVFRIRWTQEAAAYYTPSKDTLSLPEFEQYKRADDYYSTCWHEMGHATGHASRLARHTPNMPFGSPEYAREELVAEMTAAIMGAEFGVSTTLADHNRDYLAHWLKVLEDDHRLLWDAASDAAKAAKWLTTEVGKEQVSAA